MKEETASKEPGFEFWEERARLLRMIAHPVRLAILESLCDGPRCVTDINALIAIAQPHLSQHIAALRKARLIACHVNGSLRCYYILKPTLVKRLIRLVSNSRRAAMCTRNGHPRAERQRKRLPLKHPPTSRQGE